MALVTALTGSSTPASILAGANDWRTAASDLIAWMVLGDRCFSSGEIAAYIRTYRPDLAFAVTRLGEYIRDAYEANSMPYYDSGEYPTQVPRTTTGTARTLDGRSVQAKTPPHTVVMVYAPTGADGFAHDFEVFIPDFDDPTAQRAQDAATPPPPTIPTVTPSGQVMVAPSPAAVVTITGSLSRDDLTAYVRPDRRLCVPRAAFEAWVALTGQPLRGGPTGDPVHITPTVDGVEITRDPTPGSTAHHLWANRGRLAFPSPTGTPFTPGDKFPITVTTGGLSIDTSAQ